MNITRETIKETIKTVMGEEADYKAFFKKALEKAGKSIPSMSDEEKKEFFNKIDAAWDAKGEKNEALKGDQHKLDVDGDGDIEADDLADLRAGKKAEDEIDEKKNPGLWANIRAKRARGEKPAHGNSQAHKDAVKAGKKINKEESVNEAATDRDFEKVYSIFDKKDYFGLKGSIKTMLGNWQRALDKGDKGAQQYSKEDIIKNVTDTTKARAKHTYDELVNAINKKDIKSLKSKLRHDQPFSLMVFAQVTGKKLPKSTRDIHSFLDNEFMNESVNEGKSVLDLKTVQKEITKKCKDVDGVKITKGNKLTGIKELEIKSDWITSLKVKSDGNIYTDDSLSTVGGFVKSESELYKFVNSIIQQEIDYHKKTTKESVNESSLPIVDKKYGIAKVDDGKGNTWYVKKIDSTHMYMSNNEKSLKTDNPGVMAHHIGQHRSNPYYKQLRAWLKESVNEAASRTAMEIGGLTGMNKDAIQKFVDDNNLDIEKVFQFVKKGKLKDRMELVSAVAGKPNNPVQKKMIKMFAESAGCGCGCGTCSTPVNEARLGKVSLLRGVEKGDSSYVEGVKISPSLAFELRMFLERPMLAKTRTGIAINQAQMKDAIGMLAKVGVEKRLSSGVKKEFSNLLKKYNK
jgi:hypothetical protein